MPRKLSAAQKAQREAARQALVEKEEIAESSTAIDDLWKSLNDSNTHSEQLEEALEVKEAECEQLRKNLKKAKDKSLRLKSELDVLQKKYEERYRELRAQRQITKRQLTKIENLENQIGILKSAANSAAKYTQDTEAEADFLKASNQALQDQISDALEGWTTQLEDTHDKLEWSKAKQRSLQKELRYLRKCCKRNIGKHARKLIAVKAKIEKEKSTHNLMEKGVITNETQRQGTELKFMRLLTKLTGINSDHCSKEKKDARLLKELKDWAVEQSLGEDAMVKLTKPQIGELFVKAEKEMIKKAGGKKKWEKLSEEAKATKQAGLRESILSELGKEELDKLPEDKRRILELFIWAGCCCHKDLNTVRAGYMAMSAWWKEAGVEGPVMLANRDNDPVIKEREAALVSGDTPTPAQERAFQNTTRGAVKLAQIAGALLNHKDDKKGHHDLFRFWWWEVVGTPFTFPDTSNNRFQSYCDAAIALLLHGDRFLEFLETLRMNKNKTTLNHMEQNFANGLQCESTRTELAALALYAEAVSYPYMKAVREASSKNENMLDLGPLHTKVYEHMEKIIDQPELLLSSATGTLNGEDWQNPDVIAKIQELSPTLPHLQPLLLEFFKAALDTWERFTSEFAPGGEIDEATAEERDLAWLPTTNDENEGALGSFRCLMRHQPQLTLMDYNALAMFFRNNTQEFMASKFTDPVDYRYLRELARNSRGEEKKRRMELVQHRKQVHEAKQAKRDKREKQQQEREERLAGTAFIWDPGHLRGSREII